MPNRLAGETSPYLLQHQHNPIDWYPWGAEAFQRAKLQDKPVFLSVGYSSCHWCHVMAHETFEDPAVGELLNRYFVCIKVDREERPDVDEAYMTAVQLYAGRGGWPMSVWLTPDKKPFLAGTYFPKRSRGQSPGFVEVCAQITEGWRQARKDIQKAADEFTAALRQALIRSAGALTTSFGPEQIEACVQALHADYDQEHGGFGPAPKFPPHSALAFLLAVARARPEEPTALDMAGATLERIALGGIHDHVGGGFHRYSTDDLWLLPHFEKMLYDNAQLLSAFVEAAELDVDRGDLFVRAAQGIVGWLGREMTTPEGLFACAIDADSEGEEGRFYVWSLEELEAVLGDRVAPFAEAYRFARDGNYLDEATRRPTGLNIPHLERDLGDAFRDDLERLRHARDARVRPGLDGKALAGWNGLMIAALAQAGYTEAARRCGAAWLAAHAELSALPRMITAGRASGHGFFEDYAYLTWGLLELDRAVGGFQEAAERIADQAIDLFQDRERGGFFASSSRHEELFGRTKPALDNAMPSANGVFARCLIRLGRLEQAAQVITALGGWLERAPTATETLHLALFELLKVQVASSAAHTAQPAAAQALVVGAPKAPPPRASAKLASRELALAADGLAHGEVIVDIPEGYHLNTNAPPARWLKPTEVLAEPLAIEVDYPPGERDEYRGQLRLPFALRGAGEFELRVRFQMCTDDACMEPSETVLDGIVRP